MESEFLYRGVALFDGNLTVAKETVRLRSGRFFVSTFQSKALIFVASAQHNASRRLSTGSRYVRRREAPHDKRLAVLGRS